MSDYSRTLSGLDMSDYGPNNIKFLSKNGCIPKILKIFSQK